MPLDVDERLRVEQCLRLAAGPVASAGELAAGVAGHRVGLAGHAFSDAGQLTDNISIAFGATIENGIGGSGGDTLVANAVENRLTGGGGGDVFVFTQSDAQAGWLRADGKKMLADRLLDFVSGEDRIDLSAIDAVQGAGANEAFSWIGGAAFSNQAGQLRAVEAGGQMRIEGDTDGNGIADLVIVASGTTILAGDFVL